MSINTVGHTPLHSDSEEDSRFDGIAPVIGSVSLNLEQDFSSRNIHKKTTLQQIKSFVEQKEHEIHDIVYNAHVRRQFLKKYLHWTNILTIVVSCMCLCLLIAALVVGLIFLKTRSTKLYPGSFVILDPKDNAVKLFDAYLSKFGSTVGKLPSGDASKVLGGSVVDGSFYLFWQDKWEEVAAEEMPGNWKGASGTYPNGNAAVGFGYDHESGTWMALTRDANKDYFLVTKDGTSIPIPGVAQDVEYARVARHRNQVLILVNPKSTQDAFSQQLFEVALNTSTVNQVNIASYHFDSIDSDIYAELHENEQTFLATARSANDSLTEGGKLYGFSVQNHELQMVPLSAFIEVGELDGSKSFHTFFNYEEWNADKTKTIFVRVTTLITTEGRLYAVNSKTAQVYADVHLDMENVQAVGLNTRIKG